MRPRLSHDWVSNPIVKLTREACTLTQGRCLHPQRPGIGLSFVYLRAQLGQSLVLPQLLLPSNDRYAAGMNCTPSSLSARHATRQ